MKLIVAQGNPGSHYARTRHNVGWQVLDAVATIQQAEWKRELKFNADIATFNDTDQKVLLVKPLSFYNETGPVVQSLIGFYKLAPGTDVLIIHDELALPFGTVRVRHKGSDAGNNGIKSINQHIGDEYSRIRIGIWHDSRDQMDDAAFVLNAFTADEQQRLTNTVIPLAGKLIEDYLPVSSKLPATLLHDYNQIKKHQVRVGITWCHFTL